MQAGNVFFADAKPAEVGVETIFFHESEIFFRSLAREELNGGVGIKASQNDEVFPAERDEFRLIQPPHVFDDRRDCRDVPFFHPVFKFEDRHLIIFAADSDIIFERGQKQVAAGR